MSAETENLATELMKIYWDCHQDQLNKTISSHALKLAAHVQKLVIEARIDEIINSAWSMNLEKHHDMEKSRIKFLQSQLDALNREG